MTHCALFNGIGGFQLAAEWMGWENYVSCEINPILNQVTKYYWPNCIQHEDIKQTDFTIYQGQIDIVTGGFPCQPYSVAGKRLGKEDERHLWPEMLRAIREIQPRYIVGENVYGLINWNGGLVFDEVQADLENEGYEVAPVILPACAVNAPHRRDRVWFVAYASSINSNISIQQWRQDKKTNTDTAGKTESGTTTNSNGIRLTGEKHGEEKSGFDSKNCEGAYWDNFPTQSPVCSGNDGVPSGLDGITFSKWRNESIKAAGNAIVPQVALQIFKAIQ